MIQGQYLALKMRASEKWLKLAGDPSTESNHRESEPPTDIDGPIERERMITCKQLDNTVKLVQLILIKTYPIKWS
jgi:hypothetical protein